MPRKRSPIALVKPAQSRKVIPPAVEFVWSALELERHRERFWRAPKRLASEGRLAAIWDDGSQKGCPSASSVLPVLALHAWPNSPADEWTEWTFLSRRRIAALAGIDKGTVAPAVERLVYLALAETRRVKPHPRDGGPMRVEYRLHRSLYPKDKQDPWFGFTGSLLYGGVYSMLPRPSARHLFLTIACLDPIHNEADFRESIAVDHDDPDLRIDRLRAESPASLSWLANASGLSATSTQEALNILLTPIFDSNALALVSAADGPNGRFYFPVARSLTWTWIADLLNDAGWRERVKQERWGTVLRKAA